MCVASCAFAIHYILMTIVIADAAKFTIIHRNNSHRYESKIPLELQYKLEGRKNNQQKMRLNLSKRAEDQKRSKKLGNV